MLRRLADNSRVDSLATRMRDRRFQLLDPLLRLYGGSATVLDVGGTPAFWRSALASRGWKLRLTILNLSSFEESGGVPMESVVGDARDMSQFSDRAYDILFFELGNRACWRLGRPTSDGSGSRSSGHFLLRSDPE